MLEFEALLRSYADRVEGYLHSCFTDADEPQQVLFDAMRYSLLAGGKRLRPVLAQAFCELCGGSAMDALPFAAAVEMVHTYSLIHDDLPCMDNDDYRRGRLTNHKVYGEATAVLAGDALLTAAFGHLAAAPLPASRVVKATRVLSLCAGELGMVGGQVLDMEAEHRVCTEEEVLAIQSRKTGALISAACQLGVIAAGGSPAQQQRTDNTDLGVQLIQRPIRLDTDVILIDTLTAMYAGFSFISSTGIYSHRILILGLMKKDYCVRVRTQ